MILTRLKENRDTFDAAAMLRHKLGLQIRGLIREAINSSSVSDLLTHVDPFLAEKS